MISSNAAFDCLYIGTFLEGTLQNFTEAEIHLFSYLGCLLSLYEKRPAADWGYGFSGTRNGAPFSLELHNATKALQTAGYITAEEEYLKLTADGQEELEELGKLSINHERISCLNGACSCLLTMPVGVVRDALFQEPMLRPSIRLNDARPLLEGPGLPLLYAQFAELSDGMGVHTTDLLIPATGGLSFARCEGSYNSEFSQQMTTLKVGALTTLAQSHYASLVASAHGDPGVRPFQSSSNLLGSCTRL